MTALMNVHPESFLPPGKWGGNGWISNLQGMYSAFESNSRKYKSNDNPSSSSNTFKGFDDQSRQSSMHLDASPSHEVVELIARSTVQEVDKSTSTEPVIKKFAPPLRKDAFVRPINADSTPIQIWEGEITAIDAEQGTMEVSLIAKMGIVPRHTGVIDLEWVSDQDRDLVRLGAVFYLTLFKRTKRGSIENTQELRFRRRPSWSAVQIQQIDRDADMILSKMKALPIAE